MAHTDCMGCHSLQGALVEGETCILSAPPQYVYHVQCAPAYVRALALFGTIVFSLRAILGIDTHQPRLL